MTQKRVEMDPVVIMEHDAHSVVFMTEKIMLNGTSVSESGAYSK